MAAAGTRIASTHAGSLPRPPWLIEGADLTEGAVTRAVAEVVSRQVEIGIDVVGDGEAGKASYATYVLDRLAGFGDSDQVPPAKGRPDLTDFPSYRPGAGTNRTGGPPTVLPVCVGPISYVGQELLRRQLEDLAVAVGEAGADRAFVTAASPGLIARFMPNRFYAGESEYLQALGAAMKQEYDAIAAAGFQVQLDCPDLTAGWHATDGDLDSHRRLVAERLEVIDDATRDIPADMLRLHTCWGNYEGPHHHDIPLGALIDLLIAAHPAALSFEAANPRHEHEWEIFEDFDLPEDQQLIPGVIDSTTNYIEHPRLVAQRLERYTRLVGPERVVAGTDCGFATWGSSGSVNPEIAWAKLAVLAEGAALASAYPKVHLNR
jgi:5-methyltetrahydropteroyltriglutamate--homocysteine methyltransferase